jgi:hypothetical protein
LNELCIICGAPAEAPHHVTWRGAAGAYLDPEFRAPLCHSHHEFVGEDRWTGEGTAPNRSETFLDSLELRLGRTAIFVGRVAESLPEPLATLLASLAEHLARWAAELAEYIACS